MEMKWHPVRTKRDWPKIGKTVLATVIWIVSGPRVEIVHVMRLKKEKVFSLTDDDTFIIPVTVSAWMEYPEPYNAEKKVVRRKRR